MERERDIVTVNTFMEVPLDVLWHLSWVAAVTSLFTLIVFYRYWPAVFLVFLFCAIHASWVRCLRDGERNTRIYLSSVSDRYKSVFAFTTFSALLVSLVYIASITTSHTNGELAALSIMLTMTGLCALVWNRIAAFQRQLL